MSIDHAHRIRSLEQRLLVLELKLEALTRKDEPKPLLGVTGPSIVPPPPAEKRSPPLSRGPR